MCQLLGDRYSNIFKGDSGRRKGSDLEADLGLSSNHVQEVGDDSETTSESLPGDERVLFYSFNSSELFHIYITPFELPNNLVRQVE